MPLYYSGLFSNFPVQIAIIAGCLAGVFLLLRAYRIAGIFLILAFWNFGKFAGVFFVGGSPPLRDRQEFKALYFNVLTDNEKKDKVVDYLMGSGADFIGISENDDKWTAALDRLKISHPYSYARSRDDNFGVALYSRYPFVEVETLNLGLQGLPSISALLRRGGRDLRLLVTHTLPPTSKANARIRDAQLVALEEYVASVKVGERVLVLGDLNVSPWSKPFKRLIKKSGLKDSRKRFGIQATWPASSSFWRIPLDHILASPGIAIGDRKIGPDLGSDHLPVIAVFGL